MKKKELKNLASKIAKQEKLIQTSSDKKEQKKAENEILKLTSSIKSVEDMLLLDDYIQEILEKI